MMLSKISWCKIEPIFIFFFFLFGGQLHIANQQSSLKIKFDYMDSNRKNWKIVIANCPILTPFQALLHNQQLIGEILG